ncbi:lysosomal amino acid transporter 1 homolog [Mizuhopecten yessoensis]|uniref:lysosomal amino acid transporter 1 homolog n=1 Tax=Mizuhopecten yessoensis TaxID=6573 RepID=UPI000B45BFE9|nr:lysosomal amino acid transporter 1 homolog [Mizuhopecten yessoensis]XP_021367404.1 lysosomal amino acid transporter 1 homolog [Mizuhopecten yessoensis]XP_021367405.1 lysosomal amino acid transporter 1 homolog [Mizuhopecten yessoensis]XP_021367406.1 lysosomal amino acid transporter 1 homolog [Mizuhopecten yessoensis]XP_021367407.1 lysosomal amino acid transporter 1 homolog [Mizuhopecten yessoensis]XP_021367408.1 lysosomal amino acid transporter 1 homolog [Mizuhopecten yessoensis]XP_02136740
MPGLSPWMFGSSVDHWRDWNPFENVANKSHPNNNCSVQWPWLILRDCVHDNQGVASDILGLVSLVSWMIVSIPQMVMNCRNIRGVEGISFLLILQWTLGDATNLIGSILTNQLPLQIYLAIYFVFADIVLFCQFLYYHIWKWNRSKLDKEAQPSGPARIVLCFTGAFLSVSSVGTLMSRFSGVPDIPRGTVHIPRPGSRQLLSANLTHVQFFKNIRDESGYAIGIVSSIFYIGSRLSQLYKNYKRKSTEGLSVMMFILAVLGNITYGLSILVRSLDGEFVLHHLPWLIGSLGVIFLDLSLLCQFKYYGVRDFDTLANQPLLNSEVMNQASPLDYTEARVEPNGLIN